MSDERSPAAGTALAPDWWRQLPRPFLAMAPMSGVTDYAFRQVLARHGKPDVIFTEFVSATGLCSPGREACLPLLKFGAGERPVVVQFFGSRPDDFARAAELAATLGFDGIDINSGCPDRSVEKQGAGATLMNNPPLLKAIVRAVRAAAGPLPISIKTRIGFRGNNLAEWLPHVLETEPAAVTIHWRRRGEGYRCPAHWDLASGAVALARQLGSRALIIGNGDVTSLAQARALAAETGVDGVMIGRAAMGNPWFFNPARQDAGLTPRERGEAILELIELFDATWGATRNPAVLNKQYKAYASGFDGAKVLRHALMQTKTLDDARAVVREFLAGPGAR